MVMISEINEGAPATSSLGGLGQVSPYQNLTNVQRLAPGEGGKDVMALQQALLRLGYTVEVNGEYDDATTAAVKQLQAKLKMTTSGIFTAPMLERMMALGASATGTAKLAPTYVPASVQVVNAQPQPQQGSGAMTPPASGGSFLDRLMAGVKAQPLLFAVGAVALVGAVIFVPRLIAKLRVPGHTPKALPSGETVSTSAAEPVQMMGLPSKTRKRKSKKSKS